MFVEKKHLQNLIKYITGLKGVKLKPEKTRVFPISSAISTYTMEKTDKKNCLYSCQKHLFTMCVAFGIVPLKVGKSLDGKCHCEYQWNSKPCIINWVISLIFVSLMWPTYLKTEDYASNIFGRIEYIFQVNSSLFRALLTIIIFASNNWRAPVLAKAWNKLDVVMGDMVFDNFEKLKKIGIYVFFLYIFELICHFLAIYIIFFNIFKFEMPIPWIFTIENFFSLFIIDLFIGFYCLICWTIVLGLQNITDQVEACLEDCALRTDICVRNENEECSPEHVLRGLRIKHELYCEVIRLIQKAFGIQLLAIICSTTVDFIGGVYCIIGNFEGLFPQSVSNVINFMGVIMVFYGLRILQILFFTQLIINTAKSPAHHLNLFKAQNGSNSEFTLEVDRYLKKVANFPVEIVCCDILQLNGGFLASAASHIVTYVLVLMQFRLGAEEE